MGLFGKKEEEIDEEGGFNEEESLQDRKLTLFNQILSTFKFTSASPSATPSTVPVPVSTQSAVPSGY